MPFVIYLDHLQPEQARRKLVQHWLWHQYVLAYTRESVNLKVLAKLKAIKFHSAACFIAFQIRNPDSHRLAFDIEFRMTVSRFPRQLANRCVKFLNDR